MSFLHVNPKYRDLLAEHGLTSAADFLARDGVILWGHADRSVHRVLLGCGDQVTAVYLKKEHRIRWRERWRNKWAGFGFISKSKREWMLLTELAKAGIGCPELIAAGEENGQAFVMVAEVAAGVDLRAYLQRSLGEQNRRRFFIELGKALARMHQAGFVHPDLYAKHALVVEAGESWGFVFVDWQRGRHGTDGAKAWRTLAKLEATLPDQLATLRERMLCLRSYLQARETARSLRPAARWLGRASRALQARRQIQETRQPPLPAGMQHLIRVGNTTLYVTSDLPETWARNVATWLNTQALVEANVERQVVSVRPSHEGALVRRRSGRFWDWFNRAVRRRPLTSPDFENAAKLFRLQRFGVATTRLLAVGHRKDQAGRTVSFLLTEHPATAVSLKDWQGGSTVRDRHRVLRDAARLFRRIHKAGYFFDAKPDVLADQFLVNPDKANGVLWRGVEHVRRRFPLSPERIRKDLALLDAAFAGSFGRADRLLFLRSYLGLEKLTFSAKNLARSILQKAPVKEGVPACP